MSGGPWKQDVTVTSTSGRTSVSTSTSGRTVTSTSGRKSMVPGMKRTVSFVGEKEEKLVDKLSQTMPAKTLGGHLQGQTRSERLVHFLHHKHVHRLFVYLLICDLVIVAVSIGLEIEYLHSGVDDCTKMVDTCMDELPDRGSAKGANTTRMLSEYLDWPPAASGQQYDMHRLLADSGDGEGEGCHQGHYGNHYLHTIEKGLAYCSLAILFLFLLENLLLAIALRLRYITNFWHVLDFVVIVASIVLEFVYADHPEGLLLVMAIFKKFPL